MAQTIKNLPAMQETRVLSLSQKHSPEKGTDFVSFSCSVVSDSLRPHGLQHARLPCLSPTPSLLKLMSMNSVMPSNHLILCRPLLLPSDFPSNRSFPMSQLFASGGQSIRALVSALVFPMNIQDWFPLGLTGLISLKSKELSRVLSNISVQKHRFFGDQLSLWSKSHIYKWLLEKP